MTHPQRRTVVLVAALLIMTGCDPAASPDASAPTASPDAPAPTASPDASAPTASPDAAPPSVPPLHPDVDELAATTVTITTSTRTIEVAARVADQPARRRQGLMHVEHLPDGTGMLFLFPGERDGGFWMKDTLVPLDIAFADADGRIVDILTMEPCEADPCPTYTPDEPYVAALEVPAGWFAQADVAADDHLAWQGNFDPS